MTTMKQIAEELGVSVKTVSRVINNEKYVNDKTRAMVLAQIEKHGYKPNLLARSLVTKHTQTIGLLVSNIANPFFSEVVKGIEQTLREHGNSLIIVDSEDWQSAANGLDVLLEKRVDGIIIYTMGFGPVSVRSPENRTENFMEYVEKTAREAAANGVRFSVINWRPSDPGINCVYGGNAGGSRVLTEYLLRNGHRRIGYITDAFDRDLNPEKVSDWDVWNARYAGFVLALQKHGVGMEGVSIHCEEESFEGGYRAAREIMALPDPPTAIYAANDIFAMGALYALQECGYKVPEDFSLVGFDGVEIGSMVWPRLTTMKYDRYKLGQTAAKSLLDTIENPEAVTCTILPPALVVGNSVKRLSGGEASRTARRE